MYKVELRKEVIEWREGRVVEETMDKHFDTGVYSPEVYWEARAEWCKENVYQSVCALGRSDVENLAMEKVQVALVEALLGSTSLQGARVMEVGCGVGRWASFFMEQGASYTGVDISRTMIKMAKQRVPNGLFYELETEQFPFPASWFDLVFTITVLHHNPFERQLQIIDEMLRVTKTGGRVLLLEAIEREARQLSFNTFARTIDGWVSAVERDGRAELVDVRGARWWLLRDSLARAYRALGGQPDRPSHTKRPARPGAVKLGIVNLLACIDAVVDVRLMPFLPIGYATHAAILFRKH